MTDRMAPKLCNLPAASEAPVMLSQQVIAAVLEHKVRQRTGKYVAVLVLQGTVVGLFASSVELALAIPIGLLGLGCGVTLAWLREQRRLLRNSYYRLAMEGWEMCLLLGALGLSGLVAHWLQLSLVLYQAHLSYVLFGYVLGSWLGEQSWRYKVFGHLPIEQQYRYVQNLSPSLLFPYTWQHLRRLWQAWRCG